jgi:hypothetical protein
VPSRRSLRSRFVSSQKENGAFVSRVPLREESQGSMSVFSKEKEYFVVARSLQNK